jgi:hypothetical protein
MRYLHCHDCRLTLYEPLMFGLGGHRCPRCKSNLRNDPPNLFRRGDGKIRRPGRAPSIAVLAQAADHPRAAA